MSKNYNYNYRNISILLSLILVPVIIVYLILTIHSDIKFSSYNSKYFILFGIASTVISILSLLVYINTDKKRKPYLISIIPNIFWILMLICIPIFLGQVDTQIKGVKGVDLNKEFNYSLFSGENYFISKNEEKNEIYIIDNTEPESKYRVLINDKTNIVKLVELTIKLDSDDMQDIVYMNLIGSIKEKYGSKLSMGNHYKDDGLNALNISREHYNTVSIKYYTLKHYNETSKESKIIKASKKFEEVLNN